MPENTLTITNPVVISKLKWVMRALGKPLSRGGYHMDCLHTTKHYIEATDGYRLHRMINPSTDYLPGVYEVVSVNSKLCMLTSVEGASYVDSAYVLPYDPDDKTQYPNADILRPVGTSQATKYTQVELGTLKRCKADTYTTTIEVIKLLDAVREAYGKGHMVDLFYLMDVLEAPIPGVEWRAFVFHTQAASPVTFTLQDLSACIMPIGINKKKS